MVKSNGIAAVLSFFFPGLGQIYKGCVLSGFIWMFFVFIGYSLFLFPGLILHVTCVIFASRKIF